MVQRWTGHGEEVGKSNSGDTGACLAKGSCIGRSHRTRTCLSISRRVVEREVVSLPSDCGLYVRRDSDLLILPKLAVTR